MTSAFLPVVPYVILLWDAVVPILLGREIRFSIIENSFSFLIENDICVSQESRSLE